MKLNRKNKLLISGVIVTLYICYSFAFSNTIKYYRQYKTHKELTESNSDDPQLLKKLAVKEKQLDVILAQYTSASGDSFQNELLKNLSYLSNKHNLRIIDFREPHIITEKDALLSSYGFSLEGSFNGILLLINSIENNPSLGQIGHISFIKKKNYKTNTDYLIAEIILQKTENAKNN